MWAPMPKSFSKSRRCDSLLTPVEDENPNGLDFARSTPAPNRSHACTLRQMPLGLSRPKAPKGPIVAKVTRLRVYPARDGLPREDSVWLFIRSTPDGKTILLLQCTHRIPLSEMCKASVMRWPIERCFEEGKGQMGMDHYEHRSWRAWHRHMIYVSLGAFYATTPNSI